MKINARWTFEITLALFGFAFVCFGSLAERWGTAACGAGALLYCIWASVEDIRRVVILMPVREPQD